MTCIFVVWWLIITLSASFYRHRYSNTALNSLQFMCTEHIHACMRHPSIHTYIHTYIRRPTCLHACIHTYTYIHACYIHTYIHTYTYIYIHTHTYIRIYIHTHTYIYTHIHIYVRTYIYTCIQTNLYLLRSLTHFKEPLGARYVKRQTKYEDEQTADAQIKSD
jgi:hypothetical protein